MKPLFLLAFPLLFLSCGNNADGLPQGVIPEDSMAIILADYALAESAVNMNIKNVNVQQFDSVYAFNPLKDHGVSQQRYDSSLRYYTTHPEDYKSVYQKVLVILNEYESSRSGKKDTIVKK